jgi:hypothetical protein
METAFVGWPVVRVSQLPNHLRRHQDPIEHRWTIIASGSIYGTVRVRDGALCSRKLTAAEQHFRVCG